VARALRHGGCCTHGVPLHRADARYLPCCCCLPYRAAATLYRHTCRPGVSTHGCLRWPLHCDFPWQRIWTSKALCVYSIVFPLTNHSDYLWSSVKYYFVCCMPSYTILLILFCVLYSLYMYCIPAVLVVINPLRYIGDRFDRCLYVYWRPFIVDLLHTLPRSAAPCLPAHLPDAAVFVG